MISIKDLRFGNYINYKNNPVVVCGIDRDNISLGTDIKFKSDDPVLSYIKLTEELLLKLGFKQISHTEFEMKIHGMSYVFFQNAIGTFSVSTLKSYFGFSIKYLHEIQNILHSCTRIELFDIVAYNYYREICPYKENPQLINSFEEFLELKGKDTVWENHTYTLGDLPKNLFL
jgi:hypothetical protein